MKNGYVSNSVFSINHIVDIGRCFLKYKNIHSDCRRSLTFNNIKNHQIIQCDKATSKQTTNKAGKCSFSSRQQIF